MVFKGIKKAFLKLFFRKHKNIKIGIYGPVNSGKTTLANKITMDTIGEEMGTASEIPHETREIQTKEHVQIKRGGRSLTFNLIDTPGIATKIDFEDFVKFGMPAADAKKRAKEATRGVIEAIKWLDDMDLVLVVLDSSRDPLDQVNITILGNLDARNIPFLIVANKNDLKEAKVGRIKSAFPNYSMVDVSAKTGRNMDMLYKNILKSL